MMDSTFRFVVAIMMASIIDVQSQTVTFSTCAVGPVYTITVAGGTVGGQVYINGQCPLQAITSAVTQDFVFDTTACTVSTLSAIGTSFEVRVQQYADFETVTDLVYQCTCNLDLSTVTEQVSVSAESKTGIDATPQTNLAPTFTLTTVASGTDDALQSGTVGDSARIKVAVSDSIFFFKILSVTYSSTNLVSAGCTAYSSLVTQPGLSAAGVLYISFQLFRPVTSATVAASSLVLSVEIEVCSSACTAATCSKRKRRSDDDDALSANSTASKSFEMSTSILVYPPGQEPEHNQQKGALDNNVCIQQTSMLGLMLGLCVALVLCICVSTWLFCKLRKSGDKLDAQTSFANSKYKA